MNQHRSIVTSIVTFAVAVLVACWALNKAAELLLEALPVLIGALGAVALLLIAKRFFWDRDRW